MSGGTNWAGTAFPQKEEKVCKKGGFFLVPSVSGRLASFGASSCFDAAPQLAEDHLSLETRIARKGFPF